eukprot:Gregarina_sp_Poly_1__4013@NODE_2211_length_2480_cov_195_228761_g1426_i0_p1_GENE_NODE_2211_length_2480_cov_195_228761_g1426_i0NODE_2211_length_2480_cov_195_228761_g1426_i0_p1_ORF_typecomplete_len227_score30_45_NODE_2211_length_2480_cov_195_228761_g1426_i05681248
MSKDALKTKLVGPLIPQEEAGQSGVHDEDRIPVLGSNSEAPDDVQPPLKKRKGTQDATTRRNKGRFKRWLTESVLPTCCRRRVNGEGRIVSPPPAPVRRDTDIPILTRKKDSKRLSIDNQTYTKRNSGTTEASTGPIHTNVQVTTTVMPPPKKKCGRGALLGNKTVKEVVIPRGQLSEPNLGAKQNVFKRRKKHKGTLPRVGYDGDMYKAVIPNDLTNNPVWSKPP